MSKSLKALHLVGINEKVLEKLVKTKECHVLESPNQSPYLNPTEMLWKELKRATHPKKPTFSQITVWMV